MLSEKEFLDNYDITQYDRPSLTTDIVLFTLDKTTQDIKKINVNGLQVLLIKRAAHPFMNKWALPGGFCKSSESTLETAKRELFEETNVDKIELKPVGVYSTKNRDPRGWIISNAFTGMTNKDSCNLRADTDAWEAAWFTITGFTSTVKESHEPDKVIQQIFHRFLLTNPESKATIPVKVIETREIYETYTETTFQQIPSQAHESFDDIAFDHGQIICETYLHLQDTLKHDIRPLFNLFPAQFTIGELQKGYETIMQSPVQNFRRTINPYVTETSIMAEKTGHRPAKLFTRNHQNIMQQAYLGIAGKSL